MKRRSLSKQEKQYLKQVRKALYVRNSKTKDILAKLRDEMDDLREDGEECESLESVLGTPESIASIYFSEEDIRALQHRARIATVVKVVVITLVTVIVLYITGIIVTDVLISSNEQDVITITELMN